MLYPLTFHPVFKERVWGGRELERFYRKPLPPRVPIGESWEITDRPGDVSVIANGPLAGRNLRWLMEHHERDLLGDAPSQNGLFPLLIKILDARDKLSLQVHPPAGAGGEPKTELWYIAHAGPKAGLYAGLKRGVTRSEFEKKITSAAITGCFHQIPVRAGNAMFLPSGRVHALGADIVLFEIQQNSDTTYRVFDWNRLGTDGRPRELHVAQSLASIDFQDFEPSLVSARFSGNDTLLRRSLAPSDAPFVVEEIQGGAGARVVLEPGEMRIVATVRGSVTIDGEPKVTLSPGEFCLVPAVLKAVSLEIKTPSDLLLVRPGRN